MAACSIKRTACNHSENCDKPGSDSPFVISAILIATCVCRF